MPNMTYCRFRNTLTDLRDCEQALSDGGLDALDEEERRAAEKLIKLCARIADDMGANEE